MRRFSRLAETQKTKAAAALAFTCLLAIVSAGGVFGAFSASVSSTGNQFSTTGDLTPPTIERAVLRKSYGGVSGFTGCGIGGCSVLDSRQFYVYAQVVDQGSPPSGVNTVNTNVGGSNSSLTTAGGPWTVDGQTFNYRSGLLTRTPVQLAAGSRTYTIAATDNQNLTTNAGPYAFEVDTTQPQPSTVDLANGGSTGIPDAGDTITYNFDSPMDPSSLFGNWTSSGPPVAYTRSWDGTSIPVQVRFTGPNSYGGELTAPIRVSVLDAGAGTPTMNAGQVRVLADDWSVKCQAVFNGTAQMTSGNTKVLVTLGSQTTSGQLIQPRPMSPTAEVC